MVKYLIFLWMIITISYIVNGMEGQGMDYQRKYCHKKYKTEDLTELERFLCSKTCNWKEDGKVSRQEVLNLNSLPFKNKFKYLFQNDAKKLIKFESCLRKSIQNGIMKCEDIPKLYTCYASLVSKNSHLLTKHHIPVEYMSNKRKSGDVGPAVGLLAPQSVLGMKPFVEEFPNISGNKRGLLGRKSYVQVEKSPNNNRVILVLSSAASKTLSKVLDPIVENTARMLLTFAKIIFPNFLANAVEALARGFHIVNEGIEDGVRFVVNSLTDGIEHTSNLLHLFVIDPFLKEFYNARKNNGEEPIPNSYESLELGIRRVRNIRSLDKKQHIMSSVNKVANPQLKVLSPPVCNDAKTEAGCARNAAVSVVNGVKSVAKTIYDSIFSSKNKNNTYEINNRSVVQPIYGTEILALIKNNLPMMVDYIRPNIAKVAGQITEQVSSAVVPHLVLAINSLVNQLIHDLKIAASSARTHMIKGAGLLLNFLKARLLRLIKDIHTLAEP